MDVGFIGLGQMGRAIATRLLDAGHDLVAYNRTAAATEPFAARGARIAANPREAAAHSGIVMTMLANDDALAAVAEGQDGIIAGLPAGGIHVVMGTHSVQIVQRLAAAHGAAGQILIAAPVLGRPEAVVAGRLGIIVAGDVRSVERCRPLFAAIGPRLFEAGETVTAAVAIKIANNFLLGCAIEALGEAFALTEKMGADPALFHDVIVEGLFSSPAYRAYARLIADKTYDNPGFTARLGLKDAELALAAGAQSGVPLPTAHVWRESLLGAIAHGEGECDWAVMARQIARAGAAA